MNESISVRARDRVHEVGRNKEGEDSTSSGSAFDKVPPVSLVIGWLGSWPDL